MTQVSIRVTNHYNKITFMYNKLTSLRDCNNSFNDTEKPDVLLVQY